MESMPTWFPQAGTTLALLVGAFLAYRVTVTVFRNVIRRVAARTASTWDDRIIQRNVLSRLSRAIPAVVVYYGIGPALGLTPDQIVEGGDAVAVAALVTQRVALAFLVLTAALSFSALLDAINDIYNESYAQAKSRPIKGYMQVVGLIVYIAAIVVVISILADRSPLVFLSGLGALTAVLMLVFRDTILSLVASLQIMSNDIIRIGDWVEMPQANADGDVIDIALHTVKIQNWDKTITTIPTHRFISDSFRNWRGMSESGGRRIKRSVHLDLSTVRFLTDEEVARLSKFELLHEYMAKKQEELSRHRAQKEKAGEDVVPETRRLTNAGTFRAYVFSYLKAHPLVHDEMTLLVRQLAPTPKGLPIEVYCFTNDTAWATYEGVQGDIFDHLIAILPEFGLEAFQEPAGSDFARIAGGRKAPSAGRAKDVR
ncbi:MAG: mechanosensitive ion channel [Gemmatimonadetes bacterium]|nr:mechanosensitive ion channel family protein [Gemmatimonadota bacterium]NNL29646.1 mechanosensitive ion channel [Gemmatimonadota bacterium]